MEQRTHKPKIGRPATGQMPQRIFRMDDDNWAQVVAAAEETGETVSVYVRRVLLRDAVRVLKASGDRVR